MLSTTLMFHITIAAMKTRNSSPKFKGLINGKDWETGTLKNNDDDLTVISRNGRDSYVFEDSVSRFTGFVNDRSEEIYEGDLLMKNAECDTEVYVVFWDNVSQQWALGTSGSYDDMFEFRFPLENRMQFSVIGHSFTHCHLLESSNVYHEV